MTALLAACALGGAVGASFLLAELPWFGRRPLHRRLGPYLTTGSAHRRTATVGEGIAQVLLPGLLSGSEALSRALGVVTSLPTRLERAAMMCTPAEFRVRQLLVGVGALLATAAATALIGPPLPVALIVVLGVPVLAVLSVEQHLSARGRRRCDELLAEMPVVVEQLGMMVRAGLSLQASLARLGARGDGVVASEVRRVLARVRAGASLDDALAGLALRWEIDPLRRLTSVLALHRDAGDLGTLIAREATTLRAEAHRELLERIERRSQLVWVPVTVATLLPGLVFLAVPFISALSAVTGG